MAAQLLLINPRRRKRRHSRRRYHARRRRRAVAVNPIRRRHRRHRSRNPRRYHARRRHRNPSLSVSGITRQLMPAAVGAAGAIGVDLVYNYANQSGILPSAFTGNIYLAGLIKIGAALGVGFIAKKAVGPEKGNAVMLGGLTVVLYQLIQTALLQGGLSFAGLGGLGAYMHPQLAGPTYNPAPYLAGFGANSQSPLAYPSTKPLGAYMHQPYMAGSGSFDDMF